MSKRPLYVFTGLVLFRGAMLVFDHLGMFFDMAETYNGDPIGLFAMQTLFTVLYLWTLSGILTILTYAVCWVFEIGVFKDEEKRRS